MATALVILLVCLWIIAIGWLGIVGIELLMDGDGLDKLRGLAPCAAALLLFAVPVGLVMELGGPNDNRLCRQGHQEWVKESSFVLVGKVIVPTTSTRKAWICDVWVD